MAAAKKGGCVGPHPRTQYESGGSAATNLHPLLATFSYGKTRKLTQIGLLVGLIGSVVLAYGGVAFRRHASTRVVGGVLLAIGFGLVILAVRFGVSPFRR